MAKTKLSRKHQAFIAEYFRLNMNATRAYASVYGITDADAAASAASRLLGNDKVGVGAAIDEQMRKLAMTPEEILARLSAHARGTMDDFVDGDYLDLDRARARGVMHLIKKYKVRTTTIGKPDGEDVETHTVEVELYDAQNADVQLGRLRGMFVDKLALTDPSGEKELGEGVYDRILARVQERLAGDAGDSATGDAGKPGAG